MSGDTGFGVSGGGSVGQGKSRSSNRKYEPVFRSNRPCSAFCEGYGHKKQGQRRDVVLFGSGRRTRTTDLRVMSPTSYQLLYPAMLDCKSNNNFYNGKIFCAFHHFSTSSRLHPLSPTGIKKPSAPGWPYQICCLPGADGFCLSLYSAYLISTSASILARICGRAISPSSSATASAPSRRPASPNLTDAVSAPNIASSSSMALRGLG